MRTAPFADSWNPGNAAQYLRVHLTNLRRKIEPNPSLPVYIVTEPGVGYRFNLVEPTRPG